MGVRIPFRAPFGGNEVKIFVLEDQKSRIKWFARTFMGHQIDFCHEVKYAIFMLNEPWREYDRIYLDHDLNESHYEDLSKHDDQNTGVAVATWLRENPDKHPNAKIIIHSYNDHGAERMKKILADRGAERRVYSFI